MDELKINIAGKKYTIKEGEKININNDIGLKNLISIFDTDKNDIIEGDEFKSMQNFASGEFGFSNDGKSITYKEEKYFTEFTFDDNGNMVKRIKDSDGDGKIDYTLIMNYGEGKFRYFTLRDDKRINNAIEHAKNVKIYDANGRVNGGEWSKAIQIISSYIKYERGDRSDDRNIALNILAGGKITNTATYKDGGSEEWTLSNGTKVHYNIHNDCVTVTHPDGSKEQFNPDGTKVE